MIIVAGEPELPNLVDALRPPCCLTCRLDRRQQQSDQDTNDGDYHQQLDQCKSVPLHKGSRLNSLQKNQILGPSITRAEAIKLLTAPDAQRDHSQPN